MIDETLLSPLASARGPGLSRAIGDAVSDGWNAKPNFFPVGNALFTTRSDENTNNDLEHAGQDRTRAVFHVAAVQVAYSKGGQRIRPVP